MLLFALVTSVQFSSVTQSRLTLCDPMNCSTPGLPVHHQLLEFTQTHVHWVSDAIQPSHPLSSPSPPAPNPSQHQSLFQWVNSSHEVAKVLEFQLQHQSFQWTPRTGLLLWWTGGVGDGQGGLACCDSWGHKELDMTERLNWTEKNISSGIRSDRQSAWRPMNGGSWHCIGGSDQDHPQEKEMQKGKMAVWGVLTNSLEKKRS